MLIYDAKVLNCHSQRGRHYAVLPDGRVVYVSGREGSTWISLSGIVYKVRDSQLVARPDIDTPDESNPDEERADAGVRGQ